MQINNNKLPFIVKFFLVFNISKEYQKPDSMLTKETCTAVVVFTLYRDNLVVSLQGHSTSSQHYTALLTFSCLLADSLTGLTDRRETKTSFQT